MSSRLDRQYPPKVDYDSNGLSFESELRVLMIVAHPNDETIWAGGTILMFPHWSWRVVSLCQGKDPRQRSKFFHAIKTLGCQGSMGELDDGPEQHPLPDADVRGAIMKELAGTNYDLIVTHSPFGEYTRHRRHEEVGRAVLGLWETRVLTAKELWMFAYTDKERRQYPRAIDSAHLKVLLPRAIWSQKLAVLLQQYDIERYSWEAMTTPKAEAFWRLQYPEESLAWNKISSSPTANIADKKCLLEEGSAKESARVLGPLTFSWGTGDTGKLDLSRADGAGYRRTCGAF